MSRCRQLGGVRGVGPTLCEADVTLEKLVSRLGYRGQVVQPNPVLKVEPLRKHGELKDERPSWSGVRAQQVIFHHAGGLNW